MNGYETYNVYCMNGYETYNVWMAMKRIMYNVWMAMKHIKGKNLAVCPSLTPSFVLFVFYPVQCTNKTKKAMILND